MSLEDFAEEVTEENERIDTLRKSLAKAQRDLAKLKETKDDYKQTLHEAINEAIAGVTVKPVPAPKSKKTNKKTLVAVPLLSDTQLGKITEFRSGEIDYSTQVALDRVDLYADKILEITSMQRSAYDVTEAHVAILGDIVEGITIFPGQEWLVDAGLYKQITVSATMIADFVRKLLGTFDAVRVTAVLGNHGRLGRRGEYDPATNADRIAYYMAKLLLKDEPRVVWNMSDAVYTANWYELVQEGNWTALALHGDQFRGGTGGLPLTGINKKVQGWATGGVVEHFDDVLAGHYHQLARLPINKRTVWLNGATESTNSYASEVLAAQSDPAQWLLFVDPEKGNVEHSYGVDLLS